VIRKIWVLGLVVGIGVLFAGITVFSTWIGGITIGLMGTAEQASIIKVRFVEGAPVGDTIKVLVQNSGSISVAIGHGYANGIMATNINPGQVFVIPKGSTQEITLTFPNDTLVYGTQQRVKLITAKGTCLVLSSVYDSSCTSQYDPIKDNVGPTPSVFHMEPSTQEQEKAKELFVALVLTVIIDVGACLLANFAIQPRNRRELFVLLFFVTVSVGFATISAVSNILFPPMTIG
jgi:hypothetical protein